MSGPFCPARRTPWVSRPFRQDVVGHAGFAEEKAQTPCRYEPVLWEIRAYQSLPTSSPPAIVASASRTCGATFSFKKRTEQSAIAALQPIDPPRLNKVFSAKCVP